MASVLARVGRRLPALSRPALRLAKPSSAVRAHWMAASAASSSGESTNTRRLGALLFSGMTGTTVWLFSWQVRRYQWKVDLIEERTASLAAEPRALEALVPDVAAGLPDAQQFQRVTLSGTFDHAQQVLVGPRSAPAGAGVGGGAPAGAANESGWDVLTPLIRADGSRVIVNRGWVPRTGVPSVEQPTGVQVVSGVLKAGEAQNRYATNDVANGRYVWLDLPTLAAETGSSPLLVVACGEKGGGGGGKQQRWPHARPVESFMNFHVTPSTHLVYAATWASLSLAGAAITYLRFIK